MKNMGINFDSVISNTKGAANIAKLKVTLGLKTNELNKAFEDLGKAFYECTKSNSMNDAEAVSEENLSTETEDTNSTVINYMDDEKIHVLLEKISNLEQEIATMESQVSSEKGNMKPISTPEPMQSGYDQTNVSQDSAMSDESGIRCPKCGSVQSHDNIFCDNCGTKISE